MRSLMPSFVDLVILYHTTAFGTAEHRQRRAAWTSLPARPRGASAPGWPRAAVRSARAASGPAGRGREPPGRSGADRTRRRRLGLRRSGAARRPHRGRRSRLGRVHPGRRAALITTCVEADRIRDEYGPAAHGFAELVAVPWQDAAAFVTAAERLAGAPAGPAGLRRPPRVRRWTPATDLIALRLALSAAERADLADLGHAAAAARCSPRSQPGGRANAIWTSRRAARPSWRRPARTLPC